MHSMYFPPFCKFQFIFAFASFNLFDKVVEQSMFIIYISQCIDISKDHLFLRRHASSLDRKIMVPSILKSICFEFPFIWRWDDLICPNNINKNKSARFMHRIWWLVSVGVLTNVEVAHYISKGGKKLLRGKENNRGQKRNKLTK